MAGKEYSSHRSGGAAVRVSLVCFGNIEGAMLNGLPVEAIHADLTAGNNLTDAKPLKENTGQSYFGLCLAGAFKVSSATAQTWLNLPNPHGKPNSDVLKPIYNGSDITSRWAGDWVVDFALMDEQQAALYEAPFAHVMKHVKPTRILNNRKARAAKWWQHGEARPGMRRALAGLPRYIVTVETTKHRLFSWLPITVAPEHRLIVFPHHDDLAIGVLSSRFHVSWTLAQGGTLEDRPVYNSSRCFDTFPFPGGLTPDLAPADYTNPAAAEIAATAQTLSQLRENWLNPQEWVHWERTPEEEKAGYPARPVAKPGHEADLKKRTLTNLYNARPAWLDNAHKTLDAAVAKAYEWNDYTPDMPDEEILRRLLTLNLERSA